MKRALVICIAMAFCFVYRLEAQERAFSFPRIPDGVTSPQARAHYLAEHFWDSSDFKTLETIGDKDILEAYLYLLKNLDFDKAEKSIRQTLLKAEKAPDILNHFIVSFDKYLFDPESVFFDYELYLPVLRFALASTEVNEHQKILYEFQSGMILKNRVGSRANNFTITLNGDKKTDLYRIDAEYLLIYFYNPSCQACDEVKKRIDNSRPISSMLADGRLQIVAFAPLKSSEQQICTGGFGWICGYDEEEFVARNNLYFIRSIPSFYLLSADKTVLLKDSSFEKIEDILSKIR